MLVSAAITHIRNRTGHDVDGQISDTTMLLPWIEQEARRVRRELSMKVPEHYEQLIGPNNLASGLSSFTISSLIGSFERITGVAKRVRGSGATPNSAGDEWVELDVYDYGSPWLGYREEGDTLRFYPPDKAPGDYRVRYVQGLTNAAFTTSTDLNLVTGSAAGLPQGMEEVVIERVCATVCTRVPGDDPAPHLAEAERIWRSQLASQRARYGRSIKPGFRRYRGRI